MTESDCLAKIEKHNYLVDKIMTSKHDHKIKIELLYAFEYNNTYEVRCKVSGDIEEGSMLLGELLANYYL